MRKLFAIISFMFIVHSVDAQVIYNSTGRKGDANYRDNASVKGFDMNKFFVGSGMTFGVGNRFLSLGLSPIAGYQFNNIFTAGLSGRFLYQSYRDYYELWNANGSFDYKPLRSMIYGLGIWGRANIFQSFFVQTEFEFNNINVTGYEQISGTSYQKFKDSYWVPSLLLGGGYTAYLSEKVSFYGIVLYDVLQSIPNNMRTDPGSGMRYSISPYADRINYRVGIALGL